MYIFSHGYSHTLLAKRSLQRHGYGCLDHHKLSSFSGNRNLFSVWIWIFLVSMQFDAQLGRFLFYFAKTNFEWIQFRSPSRNRIYIQNHRSLVEILMYHSPIQFSLRQRLIFQLWLHSMASLERPRDVVVQQLLSSRLWFIQQLLPSACNMNICAFLDFSLTLIMSHPSTIL